MERTPIGSQRVDGLLELLASEAPAPGGGAVAAVAGACGAALIGMVAKLTVKKQGFEGVAARMEEIAREADDARVTMLLLADREAQAYDRVVWATRMPRDTDEERTSRLQALQEAFNEAAEVPLDVARRSVYLMGLAQDVIEEGNPNAAADAMSASSALYTAMIAALANVEVNAFAITDQNKQRELTDTVVRLRDRAAQLLREAQTAFTVRIRSAQVGGL